MIKIEGFSFALNAVAPYALLMGLGYLILNKNSGKNDIIPYANKFIFKVALPFKLFLNIYKYDLHKPIDKNIFVFSAVTLVLITVLSMIVYHFVTNNNTIRGTLVQVTFRCNFLIFATAIIEALYGESGLFVVSILSVLVIPLLNILAVISLEIYSENGIGNKNIKGVSLNVLKNPLIRGIMLGFIVNILGLRIPSFMLNSVSSLSSCANPIAFIMIGAQFTFKSFRNNLKFLIIGTFARLIIVPTLFLPIAVFIGFRKESLATLFTLLGTPVAVSSYIMAVEAGMDGDLAGQLVISTTVCGVFTMFLYICVLRNLALL